MDNHEELVKQYNKLAKQWNDQYGDHCSAMPVDPNSFKDNYIERLKTLFSSEMSERKKISITVTVVGDFKNIRHKGVKNGDGISKGELAHLIVKKGEQVLDNC